MVEELTIKPGDPPKMGRPTKLTMRLAKKIFFLGGYGMTEQQIASILDINESSLTRWKQNDFFKKAFLKAKEKANLEVERAIFRRATGMKVVDEIVEQVIDPTTKKVSKIKKIVAVRELAPDSTSARLYLINRNPERWKDKPQFVAQDNRTQNNLVINIEASVNAIKDEHGDSETKRIATAIARAIGIADSAIPVLDVGASDI